VGVQERLPLALGDFHLAQPGDLLGEVVRQGVDHRQRLPGRADTPSSVGVTSVVNNIKTNPECLTSKTVANRLASGRYQAPTFGYIFPENVQKGDPVVPNNLWDLGFLSNGKGGSNGQGPLTPTPW